MEPVKGCSDRSLPRRAMQGKAGVPSYDEREAHGDAGAVPRRPLLDVAAELSGEVPKEFEPLSPTGTPRRHCGGIDAAAVVGDGECRFRAGFVRTEFDPHDAFLAFGVGVLG